LQKNEEGIRESWSSAEKGTGGNEATNR